MNVYHKIQTVYKRDPETKFKTLIEGEYSMDEFEYLKDNKWIFTEKVDGTNIRILYEDHKITFAGRSDKAQIPLKLNEALLNIFEPRKEFFAKWGDSKVCLYGEGYGDKIQKAGKNYRLDNSFVLFDAKIDGMWLRRESLELIAEGLNVDIVPIIGSGILDDMVDIAKTGFKSTWGDFRAEGIVARPETELFTRLGERMITKIKCKDFK